MTSLSNVYDITDATSDIDDVIKQLESYTFKRAKGTGRRTGGSNDRNNLSEYEYINTRSVIRLRPLMKVVKALAKRLNIYDYMLVHYILQLQPGDFLDIQDYWQEDEGLDKVDGASNRWILGKFFSIALTDNNNVNIDGDHICVPQYHAIEFNPAVIHSIPKTSYKNTWLVYMVPDYLNIDSTLNKE